MIDPISLTQDLIRHKSITPIDDGVIDTIINKIEPLGFICNKLIFGDVTSLYAKIGNREPNLCFAGHTDVVPVGGEWKQDPFAAEIHDGILYGRGAIDMKSAIASFIAAAVNVGKVPGSISLLISGNEEGDATNGTPKILNWLKEHNEKINDCLLGEPTAISSLGDTIHIGRRGSINLELTVFGIQGHVAYQHKADNPITKLIKILDEIKITSLDDGNEDFLKSNLEVVSLNAPHTAFNIIPEKAQACINIRFNNLHTGKSLEKLIENIAKKHSNNCALKVIESSESFISKNGKLNNIAPIAIKKILGVNTSFSTAGGTSDARYIKDYCSTLECGHVDSLAHKTDESVPVKDIVDLTKIYEEIIRLYFS